MSTLVRDVWICLSRGGRVIGVAFVVLAVMLTIGACSSTEEQSDTAASETTVTEEDQKPECLKVGRALVRGIAEGLTTEGKGTLRFARAVKSEDPEGFLISADIQAPGLEGKDDVATWSMSGSDLGVGGGLLFAVDSVAREFSEWGADINEPSPAADMRQAFQDSPAFEQSRDCVGR